MAEFGKFFRVGNPPQQKQEVKVTYRSPQSQRFDLLMHFMLCFVYSLIVQFHISHVAEVRQACTGQ